MSEELHLVVRGRVVHRLNAKGLGGLQVKALDVPPTGSPVEVGTATSGSSGAFEITLSDSEARSLLGSGRGLAFQVFDGATLLLETAAGRWLPSQAGVVVPLLIGDVPTEVSPEEAATPLVEGRVQYADGIAVRDALVRLRHYANLGTEVQDLAAGLTNDKGSFALRYSLPTGDTKDAGEPLVRLVVEVEGEEVASSTLLKSLPASLRVDVTVPDDSPTKPNAIEALVDKLTPLLGTRELRTLEPVEIGVLASTARVSRAAVLTAVAADKLADRFDTAGETVDRPVLHALLKRGLSEDPFAFALANEATLQDAWGRATKDGDLDPADVPEINAFLAKSATVGARKALGTVSEPTLLREALPSTLTEVQRLAVAEVWITKARDRKLDELWSELEGHSEFAGASGELAKVQHTFQLGDLTDWNVPVVEKLRTAETTYEGLAGHKQEWWVERLGEIPNPTTWLPPSTGTTEERIEKYARELRKHVDEALPTAHMKRYAADHTSLSTGVKDFFVNSTFADFDIRYDRVDQYLAVKDPGGTVSAEDRETLKTLQRLSKITKDNELLDAFEELGIKSAEEIRAMPDEEYRTSVHALVSDPETAQEARRNAVETELVGRWVETQRETPPTPAFGPTPVEVQNLFGSLGGCECDHCKSALSPSAYLIELAAYLKSAFEIGGGLDAWTVITQPAGTSEFGRKRREDLRLAPLSCAATQTPLPHIDLVNEVLERLMPVAAYGGPAGVFRQSSTAPVGNDLDPRYDVVSPGLPPLPLRPDATAEELGAYPQDTWYPAYRLLSQPAFRASFALPFDRPTVEARLYLEDAGIPLSKLLRLELPAGEDRFPAVSLWNRRGALEAIGMTDAEALPFEQFPVTLVDLQSAWTWGTLPDGRFAQDLGPSSDSRILVGGLMQRLGLSWDELTRVRASAFVARFATSGALNLPAGCDVSTLWLDPDAPAPSAEGDPTDPFEHRAHFLEGIHRFVRLQRRLGWSFEEVDAALKIFAPNVSGSPARKTLDEAVWTALAETAELARELRLRPIELLSLWSLADNDPNHWAALVAPLVGGSLWEQTFERRLTRQTDDSVFTRIRTQGTDPTSGSPRALTDVEQRSLASALGVRPTELVALSRPLGSGPITATRENIWRLWARARIARSSGLSVGDACWLLDALAPAGAPNDLISAVGHLRLREFLRLTAVLRQARVPVADLAYLIGNDESARTRIRLDASRATTLLSTLRAELAQVVRETAPFVRDGSPGELATEWLVPALARFMTFEAAQRVFALLDTTDPLTSGTDTRESFLREVLGRILWNHELDELIAIPADASASVERRQYLVRRLLRLTSLPDISVPGPASQRPKDHPTDPDERPASELLRSVLSAFEGPDLTSAAIEGFLGRLRSNAALESDPDEAVCDVAFGEGFYADLDAMAHSSAAEIEARVDAAVRMALLRQALSRLTTPESAGASTTDYVLETLTALNRAVTFLDPSQAIASGFLIPHIRESFWVTIKNLDVSTIVARELRREYVLVALDGLREPPRAGELELARTAFQALAEETWGRPLPESRAWMVEGFRQGLERGDLSGPPPIFLATDLTQLGLPTALAAEWSTGSSQPTDHRHNAASWLVRSLLLFRDRLREIALPRRLRVVLADGFGISPETADELLGPGLLEVLDPVSVGAPVRERFLSPAFILFEGELSFDDRRRVERIWKATQVISHLKLSDHELTQFGPWVTRGLIDVRALPVDNAEVTSESLASLGWGFLDALEAVSWRSLVQVEDRTAFDLLLAVASIVGTPASSASDEAHLQNISAWTGWSYVHQPPATPDPFFASAFMSSPASYVAVSRRIRRRVLAEQVGNALEVPLPKILAWVDEFTVTSGDTFTGRLSLTQGVRQALRARHGDRAWIARSRPLIDRLREQQRDALAEYHRTARALPDRNNLFGWLLVDTEMSCCMLTTRTLFATAAVQTAIQRAFMGLEEGVTPREGYARRWQWMKQYRVWEANRKVFLFPENWLDPSLRRDKTPLFKTFEETLQQSPLAESDITKALGTYLTGLDRIARLDVRAFAFDLDGDPVNGVPPTLHVLARTMSAPYEYYYRRRVLGLRWTAWEKLDIQIKSSSHTLAIIDGRLHVFWVEVAGESDDPQVNESAATRDASGDSRTATAGARQLPDPGISVRVGYSRLDNGVWSPARLSQEAQRIEWQRHDPPNMNLEQNHSPDRLGRNLIVRVLQVGTEGSVAAQVRIFHASYYDPDSSAGTVLTNYRALFALRRCTGELERVRRHPLVNTDTLRRPAGFPVLRQTLSGSEYYLVNDQLTTSYAGAVRVGFLVGATMSPTVAPVLTVPQVTGIEATSASSHAYQYRLTVDQSSAHEYDEAKPVLDRFRPVVLNDGLRSFLFELGHCGRCPDTLAGQASAPRGIALGSKLGGGGQPAVVNKSGTREDAEGLILEIEGKNSGDVVGDFVKPSERSEAGDAGGAPGAEVNPLPLERILVSTLYHPGACRFLEKLEHGGPAELFQLDTQFPVHMTEREEDHVLLPDNLNNTYHFDVPPGEEPTDDLGFAPGDAYAVYNWEVFFHIPFRVACMLNEDQQFERAQTWFHYIFDPFVVETDVPSELEGVTLDGAGSLRRCWRFRPFFLAETGSGANDLRAIVNPRESGDAAVRARRRIAQQIAVWLENPFDPHAVATFRERSFQIAVVFRYIDNLLDWGDQLFRRDTRESVVEATQLYVLAAELLGRRPQKIRREGGAGAATTLQEALAPATSGLRAEDLAGGPSGGCCHPLPDNANEILAALGRWTGFCVPTNDKLVEHWDRVADRLFKIRHCLNIEGVRRDLPLFEPPIDPELLVRAAAAGVDIGAALADAAPSLPMFRFQMLLQRAVDFTGDVRSLGGQLLAALEKRDAEALSRLRTEHERGVLEASRAVRKLQVDEAQAQVDALTESKTLAQKRSAYYNAKPYMNALEASALAAQAVALGLQIASQALSTGAAAAGAIPDFVAGGAGAMASPVAVVVSGGGSASRSSANAGKALSIAATVASTAASTLATLGSYDHRYDDWQFQRDLALQEEVQIDKQITAAKLRKQIAEREYDNISLQIQNVREVEEELRTKFTNTELYEWMVRQISLIYFRSYEMALELARRAERAYRFERLDGNARFVAPTHWDSLKRGLLAGERLHHDLRRMEKAFLETERRDHEITRHISVAQLAPEQLLSLREAGVCEIAVPESLFDRDHPGQYHRRIKSVSISIPAVVGPYGGVHARLTLLSSVIRRTTAIPDGYESLRDPGDRSDAEQFVYDVVPAQSIVTSSGQSDSGLFQLDFRSEKVLPFEGAGAVSRWRLELDPLSQSFDTRTITDVILHMQYTARDGGTTFAQAVRQSLFANPESLARRHLVSLAASAPDALHALRTSVGTESRGLALPRLRSLAGYVPRGLQGELMMLGGFLVMRAPHPVVSSATEVVLHTGTGEPTEPSSPIVDTMDGLRLAPGGLFMFEEDADPNAVYDADDLRLVLKPVSGSFTAAPLSDLIDVVLILGEMLVPER